MKDLLKLFTMSTSSDLVEEAILTIAAPTLSWRKLSLMNSTLAEMHRGGPLTFQSVAPSHPPSLLILPLVSLSLRCHRETLFKVFKAPFRLSSPSPIQFLLCPAW